MIERFKIENIDRNNISCIYIIKNINNNKVYIGSTKNYRKRSNEHRNDLVKNIHHNIFLQRSFNRGDNFTIDILEEINEDEIINKEKEYCIKYNSFNKNFGYNMAEPKKAPEFKMTQKRLDSYEKRKGVKRNMPWLRTSEEIKKQAEGKYKKVAIYNRYTNKLIMVANNAYEASEMAGCHYNTVTRICRGERNYSRSYMFKYIELENNE